LCRKAKPAILEHIKKNVRPNELPFEATGVINTMCWGQEASIAATVVGFASSAYFYKDSKAFSGSLAFFSTMEALQAYTYTVVGQCGTPDNDRATLLAYIHLAFQPFFFNAMALEFVPEPVRKRIGRTVYWLCGFAALLWLGRLIPFDWAWSHFCYLQKYPDLYRGNTMPFCGEKSCAYIGEWHLAWEMPVRENFIFKGISWWIFVFLMPIFYGAWRISLYFMLTGPVLTHFTTDNPHEAIAIWCLMGIAIMLIAFKTPLNGFLQARRWVWSLPEATVPSYVRKVMYPLHHERWIAFSFWVAMWVLFCIAIQLLK